MKLTQLYDGVAPKFLRTKYDPDASALTDPELDALKKKLAKAKSFDEIRALLSKTPAVHGDKK